MSQLFVSYHRSWNGGYGLISLINNTVLEAEEPASKEDLDAILQLIRRDHSRDESIAIVFWKKLA